MQNSQLEIVITAKDEASQKISSFSNKVKDLKPIFTGMAVAGAAAFATITKFTISAVEAAAEAEKVQAQLGAVLKSTGKAANLSAEDINKQAKALQKITTFGDEAIVSSANLLLTFTNIKDKVFQDALPAILDMSEALGQDLKTSSIQVGKALNDPIRGLGALSKVGVTFTEEQKRVVEQLVKTGQVAEAQKLILAELNREFGGSASAAADTYQGKLKQLKEQFGDMQEEIGNALLPVLIQLVQAITPLIEKTTQWMLAHPELTKWLLIAGASVSALVFVIGSLGVLLPGIIAAFGALSVPVLAITGIIAGLALAVTNVTKIMLLFKNNSTEIMAGLKIMFKESIDSIINFFKPFELTLDNLINKLSTIIQKASSLGNPLSGAASSIGNTISSFISGRKAQGGNVMGGSTYLVGERGPEYFTPTTGGSILANGAMGGGASITININGGTYLSESVAHEIGDMIIDRFKKVARI